MKLIDLKNAFSAPTKEPNAPAKIGLFFGINIITFVMFMSMGFFMEMAEDSGSAAVGIISLLFCFAFIFVVFFIALFNAWYMYEYSSAAIEKRDSVAIWEMDFTSSFKRSIKLLLINIIYNIPMGVIYCAIVFVFYIIMFGVILGGAGLAANSGNSFEDPSAFVTLFSGLSVAIVLYCCMILFMAAANFVYQILIVLPASMSVIKSHTFEKGFEFGKNWKFMREHFAEFFRFAMIQLAIAFVGFVLYIAFYFLSIFIVGIPLLIILGLAAMYYQGFAYPTLAGDFYRKLQSRK